MMQQRSSPPLPLLVGFAAFVLVLSYLIAASLIRPRVLEFAPTAVGTRPAGGPEGDTVTIDARDTERWRFYSLKRGAVSPPDTADWDLAFRRFHVIVSGHAADAGAGAFEGPMAVPDTAFIPTTFARDTVNPALARWYEYGFVSHLLQPNDHVFIVRTRGGQGARLQFLSYYCPGAEPGCLTFRFATVNADSAGPPGR